MNKEILSSRICIIKVPFFVILGVCFFTSLVTWAAPVPLPKPSELMKPVPSEQKKRTFEEHLGEPKAPVTLIVYSCPSCSRCADLHLKTIYPLARKHKKRCFFILREYPINGAGMRASLLSAFHAHLPLKPLFLEHQDKWVSCAEAKSWGRLENMIVQIAHTKGLEVDKGLSCLKNEVYKKQLKQYRKEEDERVVIDYVPAIFLITEDQEKGPQRKRRSQIVHPDDFLFEKIEEIILKQKYVPKKTKP